MIYYYLINNPKTGSLKQSHLWSGARLRVRNLGVAEWGGSGPGSPGRLHTRLKMGLTGSTSRTLTSWLQPPLLTTRSLYRDAWVSPWHGSWLCQWATQGRAEEAAMPFMNDLVSEVTQCYLGHIEKPITEFSPYQRGEELTPSSWRAEQQRICGQSKIAATRYENCLSPGSWLKTGMRSWDPFSWKPQN